jgi:hypothetical protein
MLASKRPSVSSGKGSNEVKSGKTFYQYWRILVGQPQDPANDTRQIISKSLELYRTTTFDSSGDRMVSSPSCIDQDGVCYFEDDPPAMIRLSNGEELSAHFSDDPAALSNMSQEFAFDFSDDPAAMPGTGSASTRVMVQQYSQNELRDGSRF